MLGRLFRVRWLMATSLSYRELPPPEDLSAWIACFWQIQGAVGDGFQHRVLPSG